MPAAPKPPSDPRPHDVIGHLPELPPSVSPITRVADGLDLHLPSFLAGAGAALLVAMVLFLLLRRSSKAVGWVLASLTIVALAAGYLTFLRSQTGLGDGSIATPGAIIDDAKSATDALKRQLDKQEEALREVSK